MNLGFIECNQIIANVTSYSKQNVRYTRIAKYEAEKKSYASHEDSAKQRSRAIVREEFLDIATDEIFRHRKEIIYLPEEREILSDIIQIENEH